MKTTVLVVGVLLVGCGGGLEPVTPARDTQLVSRCGVLGLGLYETQADFDSIEQRVVAAFARVYGSEDALCAAMDGLTIVVVDGDTEIEPGIYGAFNHVTRTMRLPNRRLSQTVIGHESAHVFQWALKNQGGHDNWGTNGIDDAIERLRVSFWGS